MGTTFEGSVIDNDLLGAIPRTVEGGEVSPDTLSFEVIGDTVMGVGHYLGHAQTFARIKADYVYPEIADRRSISEWQDAGARDTRDAARDRVRRILAGHYPRHIREDVDAAIRGSYNIILPRAGMQPGNGVWYGGIMQALAKVVIIVGGMMGVGLAYHLAEAGWTDVLLIEKGEFTSRSTWHAAGQCPSFIGNYNIVRIHHYSNTLYPMLEALTGQPTGWHGCGGIRLATTPKDGLVPSCAGLCRQCRLCDGHHRPRPHPRIEPLVADGQDSGKGRIPRRTAKLTPPAPAIPWRRARGPWGPRSSAIPA